MKQLGNIVAELNRKYQCKEDMWKITTYGGDLPEIHYGGDQGAYYIMTDNLNHREHIKFEVGFAENVIVYKTLNRCLGLETAAQKFGITMEYHHG